jgi:signal transduction histidine kinase/CheY-like chemotaxis protein
MTIISARIDPDALPDATLAIALAAMLVAAAVLALSLAWLLHRARRKGAESERQVQQQTAWTRALFDALPYPVLQVDRGGTCRALNAACTRVLGLDAATTIGRSALQFPQHCLLPGTDGVTGERLLHRTALAAIDSGRVQRAELDYTGGGGARRHGLLLQCPLRNASGEADGAIGVLLDVTGYVTAEREARATEHGLRDVVGRIPAVVFALHRAAGQAYRPDFLAGDLRAMLGLERQDLFARDGTLQTWPFHDRVHAEDATGLRLWLRRVDRGRESGEYDFRAHGESGLHWLRLAVATERHDDGSVRLAGYLIDTTGASASQQTLRAARDAAERASKAKADFLATVSHEIRTPMNGVVGLLELLGHTKLDAPQRELLHAVDDSASVLLQILDDVLDFSKLEAGSLRLDEAPFDPRVLLDNVVGMLAGKARGKGLRVEVAMDSALAGMLRGDGVRLRQILLNLLGNAVKFTEHGSVGVDLRVLGDDGDAQRLRLRVADTGIGVPAERQAALFAPFAQAETWTARRYGGTGLGLAICKQLVELMGGGIALRSQPGSGTVVDVELRLPVEQREPTRPPGVTGGHAIVRLQSPAIAAALVEHLTALGLSAEQVPPDEPLREGAAAQVLFADAATAETSRIAARLVLVDTGGNDVPTTPAADDAPIHLGADPLKWQSVTRACMQAMQPLRSASRAAIAQTADRASPKPATTAGMTPRRARLLVADDHPVGRMLVGRQLAHLGHACDIVEDGRAAFDALRNRDYALLLTDCQMPGMSGYELATAWRRFEHEHDRKRMPVVAMTAHALQDETARCREAGMDGCLTKPVQLRQLAAMLAQWLPQQDAPIRATPATTTSPREAMRGLLVTTGREDLDELARNVAVGDAEHAAQRLHRLLGALQLGVDEATTARARTLLDLLQQGQADEAMRQLPEEIKHLRSVLDELARP